MKKEFKTLISFREYFELKDKTEIDYFLANGNFKKKDHLHIKPLFENRSYIFVKDCQHFMSAITTDYRNFLSISINFLESIGRELDRELEKDLALQPLFYLYETFLFIHDEINRNGKKGKGKLIQRGGINEMEKNGLRSEPSYEEKAAGIDNFNKFGVFAPLYKLCKRNLFDYEAAKKLPYHLCFTALFYEKTEFEFNKALSERRKNKK